MELITKENLRLSGIYGKKIISSINASLVKEDDFSLHYKQNKTHFFFYRTNNKIYITGENSETLYNDIIRNVEFYLLRLAKIDDETLGLRLCTDLYNEKSLYSDYHIFNSLPFYDELMYFILYCEDDELVFYICEKVKEAASTRYRETWKKFSSEIDANSYEAIQENLRKVKI